MKKSLLWIIGIVVIGYFLLRKQTRAANIPPFGASYLPQSSLGAAAPQGTSSSGLAGTLAKALGIGSGSGGGASGIGFSSGGSVDLTNTIKSAVSAIKSAVSSIAGSGGNSEASQQALAFQNAQFPDTMLQPSGPEALQESAWGENNFSGFDESLGESGTDEIDNSPALLETYTNPEESSNNESGQGAASPADVAPIGEDITAPEFFGM
jgi:hypothetical protein